MLLKRLKYFVSVAELGSFTEAAAECGVSQSAISQQIKALEKELGAELIERRSRGFALTAAGELVCARGKAIVRDVDDLCRDVRTASLQKEKIRAGYLRCFGGDELHLAVAEFSESRPDVAIETICGCHEELYGLLRSGDIDLAVSDQRRAFSDEYINFVLAECGCWAEFSGRSELALLENYAGLDVLAKFPCILVAPKEQRENEIYFYKNTLGIESPFIFADSIEEGRMTAAGNAGYLLVEYGSHRPRSAALMRLPIYARGAQIKRSYCAFWKKTNENPAISEFAETIRNIFLCA